METGYLVVSISAPASTDEMTFQCLISNTAAGAERLRSGLQAFRERYKMTRIAGSGGGGFGVKAPGSGTQGGQA